MELGQHRIAVVFSGHVDKVNNHNTAQISKTELPRNRLGRFQVGLENGVVKVTGPNKAARVDVHGGQCFCLVNDQVTARLKVHPATQCLGNVFINIEQVKNRPFAPIVLEFLRCGRHELLRKSLQAVELLVRVNAYGLRSFNHHITQHALQQVQVLMQYRCRWQAG